MNRNGWVALLLLAIASAAVGAVAAILVSGSGGPSPTPTPQRVVAVTSGADSESQPEQQIEQRAADPEPESASALEQARQEAPEPPDPSREQQAQPVQEAQQDATGQSASPQSSEASPPAQAESEAVETTPEPAGLVTLSPEIVRQGEAFSIGVEEADASSVVVTNGSRSWSLQQLGDDTWWSVVPVARDAPVGVVQLVVDLYSENGVWMRSLPASLLVLTNPAPLEEIVLGGSGVAASPEDVQRDHDVRFVEHVAVSGPARWSGPWILPVEGEVTGVFGARRSYDGVMSDQWHHGHDIAAHHGDPIVAPAPGTVVWTGDLVIHGGGVIVDHGAGVYSGYWHMSLIAVSPGDEVETGGWLGNIGNTGLSTGPHLHWEVIVQGVDVDPVQWTRDDGPALPLLLAAAEETADTLD